MADKPTEHTTAKSDTGPQMDHPDVVAARIAHGVDKAPSDKPAKKAAAK